MFFFLQRSFSSCLFFYEDGYGGYGYGYGYGYITVTVTGQADTVTETNISLFAADHQAFSLHQLTSELPNRFCPK